MPIRFPAAEDAGQPALLCLIPILSPSTYRYSSVQVFTMSTDWSNIFGVTGKVVLVTGGSRGGSRRSLMSTVKTILTS